jgi:hypothetical protein
MNSFLPLLLLASSIAVGSSDKPVGVCAPAPLYFSVVSSVLSRDPSVEQLHMMAATGIRIKRTPGAFRVGLSNGREVAELPASLAAYPGKAGPCNALGPDDSRLADMTDVSGIYIAVVGALQRYYNSGFQWPLGIVDRTSGGTAVVVSTLGPYVYVLVRGEIPYRSLNCPPEETYRIDPSTFDVQPYQDRCVEGDTRRQALPRLRDLPRTQPPGSS